MSEMLERSNELKAVLFDLDGTLLDTLQDLTDACNTALASKGFPPRTKEEVCSFLGMGIRVLLQRAAPAGTTDDIIDSLYRTFTDYYREHCADKTLPYPGIKELMKDLHQSGILVAVVSNKADYAVQKLCLRFFDGLYDLAVGEIKGIPRKPAPDMVLSALRSLSCEPCSAVYIGDSDVDIKTAKSAGMDCISVTWGFRSREFLLENGAVTLVDNADQLTTLLLFPQMP